MRNGLLLAAAAAWMGSGASIGAAAVIGPVYPPPGGVTWSPSGDSGTAGGVTFTYSGFSAGDLAGGLYWGKWNDDNVTISTNGASIESGENLTFAGFSANVAQWTGTSILKVASGGGSYTSTPVNTRFTLTTTDLSGNPINFIDPDLAGLPAGTDAAIPVSGDYKANLLFEVQYGGLWHPVRDEFDALQTDPLTSVSTNFRGGFYAVPEPSGVGLVALAGLAMLGRRKRAV